jgi:sensor histidine kinase YesM
MAISQDTLDAVVPSMLLQPLVENAVRHGVAPVIDGGTIAIEIMSHNDCLVMTIRNSGPRSSFATAVCAVRPFCPQGVIVN